MLASDRTAALYTWHTQLDKQKRYYSYLFLQPVFVDARGHDVQQRVQGHRQHGLLPKLIWCLRRTRREEYCGVEYCTEMSCIDREYDKKSYCMELLLCYLCDGNLYMHSFASLSLRSADAAPDQVIHEKEQQNIQSQSVGQ